MAQSIFPVKNRLGLLFLLVVVHTTQVHAVPRPKPKLVVGIVVDQMRYDFLYRYLPKYSANGFKRLLTGGFNCTNVHYHYSGTYTGPGHAHIYNGSIPAISGIISNNWFDRIRDTRVYVTDDSLAHTVGSSNVAAGRMSPRQMLVNSIGDQLRLSNQFKSKCVSISLKDRGAILPAGHCGSAYWFDTENGSWITSSYYAKELPTWVDAYNQRKTAEQYIGLKWTPLYPLPTYVESEEDAQPYEFNLGDNKTPEFPYKLTSFSSLLTAPQGNTLTKDFGKQLIANEALGQDEYTDLLNISFSSTDYIGHAFGPRAVETEDAYLRLDNDIADLLSYLDRTVGQKNYLVFLTADHGSSDAVGFSLKHNVPAGVLSTQQIVKSCEEALSRQFGSKDWIRSVENSQIYLDRKKLKRKNISIDAIYRCLKDSLEQMEGVYAVVNLQSDNAYQQLPSVFVEMLKNNYNPKRSGDLAILMEPAWLEGYQKGTTHGSMYAYDTRVPLIWYGWSIRPEETCETISVADIASTLAQLLNILEPNGAVGKPIHSLMELLKQSESSPSGLTVKRDLTSQPTTPPYRRQRLTFVPEPGNNAGFKMPHTGKNVDER